MIEVTDPGALALVQDLGRPGWAHLGVPRAGALDRPAWELANRLLGNPPDAAAIETTLTGVEIVVRSPGWWVVTGAPCAVTLANRSAAGSVSGSARWSALPHSEPFFVPADARLRVGPATSGVRSYLAVRGGLEPSPVLGSRSTDTLSGIGPAPLQAGDLIPVGSGQQHSEPVRGLVTPRPTPSATLRIRPGPRADWFVDPIGHLCRTSYAVGHDSDRVGIRLDGAPPTRRRTGELASEGMVLGAVQISPDGRPTVFLADHPTTGGFPVVAVVHPDDLAWCAQARPGDPVRFRIDRG